MTASVRAAKRRHRRKRRRYKTWMARRRAPAPLLLTGPESVGDQTSDRMPRCLAWRCSPVRVRSLGQKGQAQRFCRPSRRCAQRGWWLAQSPVPKRGLPGVLVPRSAAAAARWSPWAKPGLDCPKASAERSGQVVPGVPMPVGAEAAVATQAVGAAEPRAGRETGRQRAPQGGRKQAERQGAPQRAGRERERQKAS